ncbi:MAG: hypothetical protein P4L83_20130 [Nevskia sp.]|nr:hypothetical protein [Nevskia sp.]
MPRHLRSQQRSRSYRRKAADGDGVPQKVVDTVGEGPDGDDAGSGNHHWQLDAAHARNQDGRRRHNAPIQGIQDDAAEHHGAGGCKVSAGKGFQPAVQRQAQRGDGRHDGQIREYKDWKVSINAAGEAEDQPHAREDQEPASFPLPRFQQRRPLHLRQFPRPRRRAIRGFNS